MIAGALLAAELSKQIHATFGIGLVECYGSTESSSTVTHTRLGHYKAWSNHSVMSGESEIASSLRSSQ